MSININEMDFETKQAYLKSLKIGRRYLNIFHQLHVITAGLETLNKDFLSMSDDVINILSELPGGLKLYQHIQNLKTNKTPIDKIDPELLPFGKEVFETEELFKLYTNFDKRATIDNSNYFTASKVVTQNPSSKINSEHDALFKLIRGFTPTPENLENFKQDEVIRDLGPDWKNEIKNILSATTVSDTSDLKQNFEALCVFDIALAYWQECVSILKNPKVKTKDEIKSNLETYDKYLSMFGDDGNDLYEKIKKLAN